MAREEYRLPANPETQALWLWRGLGQGRPPILSNPADRISTVGERDRAGLFAGHRLFLFAKVVDRAGAEWYLDGSSRVGNGRGP